jgi:hypothetical protein
MNEPSQRSPRRYFAPRFSLRTLIVAMLLLGPLGAVGWKQWQRWREREIRRAAEAKLREEHEERARIVATLTKQLNNIPGGVTDLYQYEYEKTRSDESFPESDPRPVYPQR